MNKYVIGVDAGGTRTIAASYGLDGHLIACSEASYGNILVDRKEAIAHHCTAINGAIAGLPLSDCQLLLIGAAGVGSQEDRNTLQSELSERFSFPVKVLNDAELALEAALSGKEGVLVISGTGSISICRWHGVYGRAGGWGNIVGDEGSAFNIVLQAIRRMTYCADNALPLFPLGMQLLQAANVCTVRELVGLVYTYPKGDIAALASVVEEEAQNGNEEAEELLCDAGKALAELVISLYKAQSIEGTFPLALRGGVLEHMLLVRKAMLDYLTDREIQYVLSTSNEPNTRAAWHVYRRDTASSY